MKTLKTHRRYLFLFYFPFLFFFASTYIYHLSNKRYRKFMYLNMYNAQSIRLISIFSSSCCCSFHSSYFLRSTYSQLHPDNVYINLSICAVRKWRVLTYANMHNFNLSNQKLWLLYVLLKCRYTITTKLFISENRKSKNKKITKEQENTKLFYFFLCPNRFFVCIICVWTLLM